MSKLTSRDISLLTAIDRELHQLMLLQNRRDYACGLRRLWLNFRIRRTAGRIELLAAAFESIRSAMTLESEEWE